MLNNVTVKIKWAHRTQRAVLVFVAVVVLVGIVWATSDSQRRVLRLGSAVYHLEVVRSNEDRAKGLSGKSSIEPDQGMLFISSKPEKDCFWMKDMHFSLDIIWLDGDRKVVHVEQNISPDTYPRTFCTDEPAVYVIELPAGALTKLAIPEGQILNF